PREDGRAVPLVAALELDRDERGRSEPRLLLRDGDDPSGAGQTVIGVQRPLVGELLLAVEDARRVDTLAPWHLDLEAERDRERRRSGRSGQVLRVRIADRPRELHDRAAL